MTCKTEKIPEKIQRTWTCDYCTLDVVTVDKMHRPPGWYVIRRQESGAHQGDFRHMCVECGHRRLSRL